MLALAESANLEKGAYSEPSRYAISLQHPRDQPQTTKRARHVKTKQAPAQSEVKESTAFSPTARACRTCPATPSTAATSPQTRNQFRCSSPEWTRTGWTETETGGAARAGDRPLLTT